MCRLFCDVIPYIIIGGGYEGDSESYHSDEDEAGQARRRKRRAERQKAFKAGKRNDGSDSDYSYRSVISAGGTRHVRNIHHIPKEHILSTSPNTIHYIPMLT